MIQLFHVSKSYDGASQALSDVTFKVDKGEFVFITGPSGAGKSTLLKIIFGAEAPTNGHIILDGRNYYKIPRREVPLLRRRMGFVFQDFKLLLDRTVFENVALSLEVCGAQPSEIKKRVLKMLQYVRLQHRANFPAKAISGGEQQRVAIARALVKEPVIILADEPTGNLDPDLSREILELFKEVNNKGTTVLIATHDAALIEKAGKRKVLLEGGRVA
ncbi:MAG: cell division ATP-binding protein FtsE [Deltaproteobacteria bacterium]|nr:cell division ATP-binding protein FtsE [Deltaproteobacteria bacterium]